MTEVHKRAFRLLRLQTRLSTLVDRIAQDLDDLEGIIETDPFLPQVRSGIQQEIRIAEALSDLIVSLERVYLNNE